VTTGPPDASGGTEAGSAAEVTVRQADRADLLDVFRVEKTCFSEPWPYSAFESFLGESGFLVAVEDAEVLGYVVADVTPNHGRDIGHVKDLAVRPESRGRGVGSHLLRRALVALSLAGASLVKLEVRVGNDPALGLYSEAGFEPARRIPRYYADGEDAFLMVLDLEEWRSSPGPGPSER
jgi:ribosomal-protein-alanine N-acetyltransferase